MSMTVEIKIAAEYLHVTVGGPFALAEAQMTFAAVIKTLAQHGRQKVLFDGRGIVGEPATIERFLYGEFTAKVTETFRGLPTGHFPQCAYVLLPPVLDPQRFGESVARNRGLNAKAFEKLEDARRWLGLAAGDAASQQASV